MTATIAGLGLSPLELLVVLATVVVLLVRWLPVRGHLAVLAGAVAVLVPTVVVLVVIGLRWPLVPVLLSAGAVLPVVVLAQWRRRSGRPMRRLPRWLPVIGTATCLLLVAAGVLAAWAFPVPVLPRPSGPHPVGTTVLEWTDPGRAEVGPDPAGQRRQVVVQVWYPAKPPASTGRRARYLGRDAREARVIADGLAGYLGAPGFVLDGLVRAHGTALPDAPVADGGRFPVVLFSPGLGGVRTQNTAWAEALASRGYVVVGLDHPYDSAAVVLSGGRIARTRVSASGNQAEDRRRAAGWTAVRAADLSFVRDQLDRLDGLDRGDRLGLDGRFAGRLDTGRVAVTGHSLGGAAALQAARQDPRFATVIDLDGFPHDPAPGPYRQPVLALTQPVDGRDDSDYQPRLGQVLDLSTATGYRLAVPGSTHLSFTDAPLFLPPLSAFAGSLGRTGGLRITVDASVAFLDATLRGGTGDLPATLSRLGDLRVHP